MSQTSPAVAGVRSASCTLTVQVHDAATTPSQRREDVVTLRLAPRRAKKVSWKAGTVDNELLGKKSSKKCCIFHKEHGFDSDSSDEEGECPGKGKRKKEGCDSHDHDHGAVNQGSGSSHSAGASTSVSQG